MQNFKYLTFITLAFLLSCKSLVTDKTTVSTKPKPQTLEQFDLSQAQQANAYNWVQSPYKYWAFKNIDKVFVTKPIAKGDNIKPLEKALINLNNLDIKQYNGKTLKFPEHLHANRTDALLVLKNGKIIAEHYRNNMQADSYHIWFSMSKSLTAVTLGALVDEGLIDLQQQTLHYLPELAGSAWEGTSVQMVMDMTNSIEYSEDYHDLNSDLYQFGKVSGFAKIKGSSAKYTTLLEYYQNVKSEGEHDQYFHYVSLNTEVLGMIIAKVTGKTVAEIMSEKIWSKIGAEHNAFIVEAPDGNQLVSAAVNSTLRDAGRFGQMMLENGTYNGQRVLSENFVSSIAKGGDTEKFASSLRGKQFKNFSYTNQWWHTDDNAYFAKGLFGQWLYVDPDHQLVVVILTTTDEPNYKDGSDWYNGLSLIRAIRVHTQ